MKEEKQQEEEEDGGGGGEKEEGGLNKTDLADFCQSFRATEWS